LLNFIFFLYNIMPISALGHFRAKTLYVNESIVSNGLISRMGGDININGSLIMNGSTSGKVTIKPSATTSNQDYILPPNSGRVYDQLQTDGTGTLVWGDSNPLSWVPVAQALEGESSNAACGSSVALNAVGDIMAVGTPIGLNSVGLNTGTVRVYQLISNQFTSATPVWYQIGQTLTGLLANDRTGTACALSASGLTVAVGIPTSGAGSGTIRVYDRTGAFPGYTWVQRGVDLTGVILAGGRYGGTMAISTDGNTIIGGARLANGSVGYIASYTWNGASWVGPVVINGPHSQAFYGRSISIKNNRLAVSALQYSPTPPSPYLGAVYTYDWDGVSWIPVGQLLTGTQANEFYGSSISLNGDGTLLAIGQGLYDVILNEGRVSVFQLIANVWTPYGNLITGTIQGESSGITVSLNFSGTRLALGASGSNGAVRVYEIISGVWKQISSDILGEVAGDQLGIAIQLNDVGNRVIVGSSNFDSVAFLSVGRTKVYELTTTRYVSLKGGDTCQYKALSEPIISIGPPVTSFSSSTPSKTAGCTNVGTLRATTSHLYMCTTAGPQGTANWKRIAWDDTSF